MSEYLLSVDAEFDLDDIWEFIARDNLESADRWIRKLVDALESIGRAPGIGHKRDDLTVYPVLFFPVGAYLIIYRATGKLVEIVAVTQGSCDIPSFLKRRLTH